ncbi:Palmitoyl-protein thioesterase [Taphrina deformans PYCC 5710]|uniref:Palmitoyl-protein thioesterase n=1 Tax=Taphrina deformans (strain PYCC 5710 / ATCC 11124 / CBS 356.35 / IMI 108563 / JCM 9778 / NBRC 8474) TaxID=1097556 RepID=R4XFT8_TAPDE|nr:Palmitoyl-protein thioesterase [Taphrina deformans PYCC 5710]|eukprot:CCG83359.1 Palmitoyl-protein thioesterase [Taphrina deformans PYCC 5710]
MQQFFALLLTSLVLARNLPTVVWHGLGDSADSEGIVSLLDILSNHTSSPSHAISTGPRDSSFIGNINNQLAQQCEILKANPDLKDGFNAIGFSQGGQFLRAYIERCNDPPIKSLMTWGSQHAGIVQVPCQQETSPLCQSSRFVVRSNAFSSFVQNRIIPAQYYKGNDLEAYLQGSIFLADINNERALKNKTYISNLASLHNFVMIMFEDDITVIPKQSSLFQDVDANGIVTPVQNTTYYDNLGLRALDNRKALISITVQGGHMQIDETQLLDFVDKYFTQEKINIDSERTRHGL